MRFNKLSGIPAIAVWMYLFSVTASRAFSAEDVSKEGTVFNVNSYGAANDKHTDDTVAFQKCFDAANIAGGGTIVIPEGNYYLPGDSIITLSSNTNVYAVGAKIYLKEKMGDRSQAVLFAGEDIENFTWEGGNFIGQCFDPATDQNLWEPNSSAKIFFLTTTDNSHTNNITFKLIKSHLISGAVITVMGVREKNSDYAVKKYANDIKIDSCEFLKSGQFMWDYGYLWQILLWPEDYTNIEKSHVAKYFPNKFIVSNVKFEKNSSRILVNDQKLFEYLFIPNADKRICFYNGILPENIKRGKAYYVKEAGEKYIKISESLGSPEILFKETFNENIKMLMNLPDAYFGLYVPYGSSDGKGAIDLRQCEGIEIKNCTLSSLGDAMHIQRCKNTKFVNNKIKGARMGALFIAEYCIDTIVWGNEIYGDNGSRIMSIEKSNKNVMISSNTFSGGGRGSWINQPEGITIENNRFIYNTQKGIEDPNKGRKSINHAGYDAYPEIYITLYKNDGYYDNVTIKNNIIETGPRTIASISFDKNGRTVVIKGNEFRGPIRKIDGRENVISLKIDNNRGLQK